MQTREILITMAFIAVARAAGDASSNSNTGNPVVSTSLGRVKGSYMTSRLGKQFYAFRGMKYAEAPTGERRFKQAVPAVPWKDEFDASQEGPSCPQPAGRFTLQSEDCLRLNVYTTQLPSRNSSEIVRKPVIVFFHPGGFYVFSGQSSVLGPEYLMDQDIVLVLANSRLASLGYLSTGDSLAPGNLGLKDQVESLRWVKKNIASFGGDPNCVTISGYSSGSRSVSVHLVSPMTKGLFHRAILMSGSAIYKEPLPPHQMHLARKQAEFLGCPSDTSANIIRCLKTKNATEIAETLSQFNEWRGDPISKWTPVVEPEVPGVERFLTGQPADLIREGKFHQVPVMTGITKDEFAGVVVGITERTKNGDNTTLNGWNTEFERIAPISFLYERNTARSRKISRAVRQFYFMGQPPWGVKGRSLDNLDAPKETNSSGQPPWGVKGRSLDNLDAPKKIDSLGQPPWGVKAITVDNLDAPKKIDVSGQPPWGVKEITLDNLDSLGQAYADSVVIFSVNRFAKLMARASKLPVYYYKFTYQGSLSFATWSDTKKPYGVVHHDDLLYLFHIGWFPKFEKNAPENRIIERQTAMWANFAKTGQPIPSDNEKFANVTWTPLTAENKAYMDMGDELVMKKNLYAERMNLWDRLFPLQPLTRVGHKH